MRGGGGGKKGVSGVPFSCLRLFVSLFVPGRDESQMYVCAFFFSFSF